MTVRPVESLHLGPVALHKGTLSAELHNPIKTDCVVRECSYPIITGRFSFSASSNASRGATRGSGVQSSTSSSTSWENMSNGVDGSSMQNILPLRAPHSFSSAESRRGPGDISPRKDTGRAQCRTGRGHFGSLTGHIAGGWRSQAASEICRTLH